MKSYINQKLPAVFYALRYLKRRYWRVSHRCFSEWRGGKIEEKFAKIYSKNLWQDPESVSGPGSNVIHTKVVRQELPKLISDIGAKSLLDIPCGDFNWMKELDLDLDMYAGVDIVEELVDANNKNYGNERRKFVKSDITKDPLPTADLVLCRDCWVHFSFADIFRSIKNIKKSNSQYLLTTTDPNLDENMDIYTGFWRTINLQIAPFNFPQPIKIINEKCPKEWCYNKSLGLWRIDDITIV
ncbi:MAG: class I SAM-dependent methyltransferase [Richelia sp. CSU_2_1]|nr:class I SAM-dependent methyltransferase [Microcoleus sp. SU_5_3]NJR25676.1 class I SAM-dependent methyltransferase [Richelia sp. CSU_2_1]